MYKHSKGNIGIGVLFGVIAAVVIFTIMINLAKESGTAGAEKTNNINNELRRLND